MSACSSVYLDAGSSFARQLPAKIRQLRYAQRGLMSTLFALTYRFHYLAT